MPRPAFKCKQEHDGNWHVFGTFIHIAPAHLSLIHIFWILFSSDVSPPSPLNLSVSFLRWHFFICLITRKLGPRRKREKYNPDNNAKWVNVSHVTHAVPYIRIREGIYMSVGSYAALHIFLLGLPDFSSKTSLSKVGIVKPS